MKNKRILITGAAGSIGSELLRQLCERNKIYGVDINESGLADLMREYDVAVRIGDIRNENTVRDIFSDFKPQIVFHAAAYKHVDMVENVPKEAIDTNILGTYNLLHYSKVYPVEKFIFISTDKAINPYSIMGATKRVGEIMTKNQGKGFIAVRFANVLGSRGSVIPIWQRQINQGKPITLTHPDMERYFMTIEQAVQLVIKAGELGEGGEIFVLDMGRPVKLLELANKIIQELGSEVPIKVIGIRPGEQLKEKIMLEEEQQRAVRKDNFWIIK